MTIVGTIQLPLVLNQGFKPIRACVISVVSCFSLVSSKCVASLQIQL